MADSQFPIYSGIATMLSSLIGVEQKHLEQVFSGDYTLNMRITQGSESIPAVIMAAENYGGTLVSQEGEGQINLTFIFESLWSVIGFIKTDEVLSYGFHESVQAYFTVEPFDRQQVFIQIPTGGLSATDTL